MPGAACPMPGAVGHTGRAWGTGSSSARGQDPAPPGTGRPSGGVTDGGGGAGTGAAGGLLVTTVAAWSGLAGPSGGGASRGAATGAPHWPQNASPTAIALPQPPHVCATDEPSPYASLGRRRLASRNLTVPFRSR